MATIALSNVQKVYPGGFKAIHGVDVDVDEGELIVLVGPSGCGKSTLLRMVAGLETVTEGEIRIDGTLVNRLEPKDRDIAMVFQNYALYPHMSVFDNMAYGLKNRGFPKADIETRVRDAARVLELDALLDRRPRQLSGGQRQRVAMGRAIVREPKAFLFDEPLSNLDAKLRVQMRVEIKRLQRRLGVTSLYVTHDQVEAMTLADRLVVMNGGVAEQIGRPVELYDQPATRFVAGFIGSPAMSFLDARVGADERSADLAEGVTLKLARQRPGEAGRPVCLGIRPEHIVQEPADGANALTLRVDLVEALGADSLVHATLAGTALVVRLSGHTTLTEGDRLAVAINPARVYLFDPDTGRALV